MKHKMSILFYAKSSKAAKNGLLPIYQRITINGVRIELSTNRFVEKSAVQSLLTLNKFLYIIFQIHAN